MENHYYQRWASRTGGPTPPQLKHRYPGEAVQEKSIISGLLKAKREELDGNYEDVDDWVTFLLIIINHTMIILEMGLELKMEQGTSQN